MGLQPLLLEPPHHKKLSFKPGDSRSNPETRTLAIFSRWARPVTLLRQPGGFEGFGAVREPLVANGLPLPDGDDVPASDLKLCAAFPASQVHSVLQQDFVGPGVDQLGVGGPEWLEVVEGLEVPVEGGLGAAHSRLRPVAGRHHFEVLIADREPGAQVAPIKGFQPPTHDLDVLLRHRLLLKPCGFEGIVPVREPLRTKDLPLPEGGDQPVIERNICAASPSTHVNLLTDQDFVGAGINDLGHVYRDLVERVHSPQVEVKSSLGTADHLAFREVAGGHDFIVLIVEREPGCAVAPPQGFQGSTRNLDVLLRHRPGSISGGRGGCQPWRRRPGNRATTWNWPRIPQGPASSEAVCECLSATSARTHGFIPKSRALQPQSRAVEFAPPVRPRACFVCPQFCECAGTPLIGFATGTSSASVVYHCRSSCPENAQGELPFTCFSVPLPVISPANAAVALAPTSAAVQSAPASNDFRCIAYLPRQARGRRKGRWGRFVIDPIPVQGGQTYGFRTDYRPRGGGEGRKRHGRAQETADWVVVKNT